MKNIVFYIILILLFCTGAISAQNVTGNWYGIGEVRKDGAQNSYLSEMILKQKKNNKVTGEFNYYFRNTTVQAKVSGTYNPQKRLLQLSAIPVLNFQAKNSNGADCPMTGHFTLRVARAETVLTGQFTPLKDYRFTCPSITVKFSKELKSDAPLLTVKPETEEEEYLPPAEVKKSNDPVVIALNQRAFEGSEVIEVDADSLKLAFYDNGDVDNDTISIFYNRQLVGYKKMLSLKPLNFTLPLDTSVNEIAMFAENMGKIPPNSAVAVIYANEKRYEFFMTSTYIKNATIRFRRKPQKKEQNIGN